MEPAIPEPLEFDLSWLDQETPDSEAPSDLTEPAQLPPEAPQDPVPTGPDAPTAVIPEVAMKAPVSEPDAPTAVLPGLDHIQPPAPQPNPPVSRPVPRRESAPTHRTGLILGIIAGALVMALVLGVFVYGLVLKKSDDIYPNVYVAGINVGGMDRETAIAAVDEAIASSYASATLKVQLPDRTLSFNPEQTNVALDADEAIAEALTYGREGNAFSAVTSYFSSRSTEHYIDLQTILNLDTDYIRSMIDQVAAEVEMDPTPTTAAYEEAAGRLVVEVGYPQRSLDTEGLYEVVYNAFMNSDFTPLSWDYDEVPCELLDLEPYYEEYCTEVQNAEYDPETHTIVEEVPGFGFDLEASSQKLATAPAGSQVIIQLEDLEPEVTKAALEEEMFGETLFAHSTVYVVNSNRTNNLRLACEAINGLILNPDEVFSFNNVVGERTAAKGYLPATVYSGGQSLEELGGGVCQVASTLYYCTLHLDLEQVHREPHQFAVTYVPLGMDATVYWGPIDYQFKNTLSNPVKILADVENGSVNITFLGIPDTDNYVEMSSVVLETYPWQELEEVDETLEPGTRELKTTPYTGYKVVTYKTIRDASGKELSKNQEAVSTYDKRDQVYLVGPEIEEEDPWEGNDPDIDDPWGDGNDFPGLDNPWGDEDPDPAPDPAPADPDAPEGSDDPGSGEENPWP